jgi:crotonobetainyl-CoA:carnitine CoA-transferase CaiB-like acyl-CoA transferase
MSTLSGFSQRDCTTTQYAYPDGLSALHGLVAVMAAVAYRSRTGAGQSINLSQFETCVAALGPAMMEALETGSDPVKRGNGSPHRAPQGCYPCSGDDRWCVVGVGSDGEWRALCGVMGRTDWLKDARFAGVAGRLENASVLDSGIAAWTCERSREAVMESLQTAGVAAAAVHDVSDQWHNDPQLAARGFFEVIPHLKKGSVVATGVPLGLGSTPGRTTRSGAAIGQDNEAVFRGLLDLSEAEYLAAIEAGAIEDPS